MLPGFGCVGQGGIDDFPVLASVAVVDEDPESSDASGIADAIATQIVAIVLVFPVAMDFYLSFLSGGRTLRRSCNRPLDPVEALGILH